MRLSSFTTLPASFLLAGLLAAPIQAETIDPNSAEGFVALNRNCLLYTSPSPRDGLLSRMPSSA